MTDIVAIVTPEIALAVAISEGELTLSTTNLSPPQALESLSLIGDVDMVTHGKVNGSLLIYNSNTAKWTSSTTLNAQNIDSGEF